MCPPEEKLELSEELARYLLATGTNSGLELIGKLPGLKSWARGNCIFLEGSNDSLALAKKFIENLSDRLKEPEELGPFEMQRLFEQTTVASSMGQKNENLSFKEILITSTGRSIKPKTIAQQKYVKAIEKNVLTIARGPAGTGKTYLATAMAINALKEKKVTKVILSRPVVEAGENLGYLPGDLKEKVDPHFRPLYDSLQEFIGLAKFEQFLRQGVIEITPLAYMRGRTFNESFIVLDEAQNTTMAQMRMVLTRLGYGSKIVVTGDHTQIDLPKTSSSSLLKLKEILEGLESVNFTDLTSKDVIRHELVKRIINAFETYEAKGLLNSER